MLVRTMHPSNARCSGLWAWQKTNKTRKNSITSKATQYRQDVGSLYQEGR